MIRTDYRYDRSERSLEPPDDDEEDRYKRELARDLSIDRRMDAMREADWGRG